MLERAVALLTQSGVGRALVETLRRSAFSIGVDTLVVVPDEVAYATVAGWLDVVETDVPLLRVAAAWSDQRQSVLELAMLASNTLREALQRACRYEAFWSTSIDLVLVETPETCSVQCITTAPPGRGRNAVVAILLANLVRSVERALGSDLGVAEVRLRWAPRIDPAGVRQDLHVPVQFGAAQDALLLPSERLEQCLPRGYRPFAEFFDRHLERVLQALPGASDLRQRVQRLLAERLVDGEVHSLSWVAKELGCSERTLQRRLAQEGTTFSEILDRTRLHLASSLLRSGDRSVGQIAFALGFATPAAFGRAFKRWTGIAPGVFRASPPAPTDPSD